MVLHRLVRGMNNSRLRQKVWDPGISKVLDLRGVPVQTLGAQTLASTALNLPMWRALLGDFDLVLLGFLQFGFPTGSHCAMDAVWAANHPSLYQHESATRTDLAEEVAAGTILSFDTAPFWAVTDQSTGVDS